MNKLDEFFAVLRDGRWHSLNEIAQTITVEYGKLIEVARLLAKANIIQFDEKLNSVRISEEWIFLIEENCNKISQ